jgi:thiamine pyrophosphokinase
MARARKNPLFAEERMLTIEELKYALESWQQTLAFARTLSSYFISL